MKSIIHKDPDVCYLCGRRFGFDPADKHHVFYGPYRRKSEKYGLTVYLHHNSCHIFGEAAVHNNADVDKALKADVQAQALKHYNWTVKDFIAIFGRNYI